VKFSEINEDHGKNFSSDVVQNEDQQKELSPTQGPLNEGESDDDGTRSETSNVSMSNKPC